MGRAKSASLFSYEAKKCACSLFSKENNSCCHDESKYFILEDDQSAAILRLTLTPEFILLVADLGNSAQTIAQTSTQYVEHIESHRPPLIPLYKTHCAYMFYDDGEIA
jgi:hypothetical protein